MGDYSDCACREALRRMHQKAGKCGQICGDPPPPIAIPERGFKKADNHLVSKEYFFDFFGAIERARKSVADDIRTFSSFASEK